jgi:hypothetical protein
VTTFEFTEVPHVMGKGIARVEQLLPASRGATLFGYARQSGLAEQAISGASGLAATQVGRLVQHRQEQQHNLFERLFHVSEHKRAAEARQAQNAAMAAGLAAAAAANLLAMAGEKYLEKRQRETAAERILQVVGYAALADDGTLIESNKAHLAHILDAFRISGKVRQRLARTPIVTSLAELENCRLTGPALEAVAHYAFHARAHVVGAERATRDVGPLFIRIGMSQSQAGQVAEAAKTEYLSEQDVLSRHYLTLELLVVGIGRRLHLPIDTIEAAARDVIRYNPYEQARIRNKQTVATALRSALNVGMLGTGGPLSSAVSIAAQAGYHLLSSAGPLDQADVQQSFAALCTEHGIGA